MLGGEQTPGGHSASWDPSSLTWVSIILAQALSLPTLSPHTWAVLLTLASRQSRGSPGESLGKRLTILVLCLSSLSSTDRSHLHSTARLGTRPVPLTGRLNPHPRPVSIPRVPDAPPCSPPETPEPFPATLPPLISLVCLLKAEFCIWKFINYFVGAQMQIICAYPQLNKSGHKR